MLQEIFSFLITNGAYFLCLGTVLIAGIFILEVESKHYYGKLAAEQLIGSVDVIQKGRTNGNAKNILTLTPLHNFSLYSREPYKPIYTMSSRKGRSRFAVIKSTSPSFIGKAYEASKYKDCGAESYISCGKSYHINFEENNVEKIGEAYGSIERETYFDISECI
jgi:hypothetical protein